MRIFFATDSSLKSVARVSRQQAPRVAREIFVTGIDGSGKTAARNSLISRLDDRYKILSNEDELYIHFKGNKERVLNSRFRKIISLLKSLQNNYPLRGLLSLLNFTSWCLESNYLKRCADVDLILYETDRVLHPAAFSAFYFPWIRRFNRSTRFKIFHALFGPRKNSVTFYLDTDSRTASDRIERRSTPRDSHENATDLEILKREFDEMVRIASTTRLQIVSIETNNRTVEAVVSDMETVLKDKLGVTWEGANGLPQTERCRRSAEDKRS